MKIKAISLWQPWASAMALGLKTVETRSWYTSYRGPLLIHAAKKRDAEVEDSWHELMKCDRYRAAFGQAGYSHFAMLPFGGFVAGVKLTACIGTAASGDTTHILFKREISELAWWADELAWGNFSPNRFGWVTDDLQCFDSPLPARGRQGLWDVEWDAASQRPVEPNPSPQLGLL